MHRFVKGELNWVEPLNQNFEEAAAHAAAQDNPHGVTAEQLGAPTKAYVDAQLSNKADVGTQDWLPLEKIVQPGFFAERDYGGYRKDPFGRVEIFASITKGGQAIGSDDWFLTFPIGFRPPQDMVCTVYPYYSGAIQGPHTACIYAGDGVMKISGPSWPEKSTTIRMNISFPT